MASKRSQAGWLAQALTEQTGVAVTVACEGQGVGRGDWWVRWSDGPTVETLQVMARTQAAYLRPLDVAALRWGRAYTPRAWALALIAQAGRYPEITDWHELLGEAETWLDDTTLPEHPLDVDVTHRADELVADFDGHEAAMAQAVLASADPRERRPAPPVAVTKRGDATGCEVCARAVARAGTGRPARYCSPACRTTAWRRRTTQAVTKRGDATGCEVCARAVARAGTGRPARYCSPACRTTAWRRRTTQAVTKRGDETTRALDDARDRDTVTPSIKRPIHGQDPNVSLAADGLISARGVLGSAIQPAPPQWAYAGDPLASQGTAWLDLTAAAEAALDQARTEPGAARQIRGAVHIGQPPPGGVGTGDRLPAGQRRPGWFPTGRR